MSEKAAQLKAEGNALYVAKDFALATVKYTEAIALDGKNAILFANRAACRLALGQWATIHLSGWYDLKPKLPGFWTQCMTRQV